MRSITEISERELQILFIRYSRSELIKLLGIKEHEYSKLKKEKCLQNGCEFLKSSPATTILDLWRNFKSRGEMARFFKVSTSFLDTIFKREFHNYRNVLTLRIDNADEMKKALQTYGSKGIVAKLMGINIGDMNKLCKAYGIKHTDMSAVRSGYESSKGLAAEKEFEKIRGSHILKDMNDEDPRAPYDYIDDEYGKVNVKASKSYYSRRRRDRYAKFNLNGGCDTYALFVYDDNFKELLYYIMVDASEYPNKTTSFYHKDSRLPSLRDHETRIFNEKRRGAAEK